MLTARGAVLALSAWSGAAMLYVGAYQVRAVDHLSCPLFKHGCEAVADAPFARPFGVPDGFIAAGMYALLIALAWFGAPAGATRLFIRALAILAGLANVLGALDMSRLGAFCFYCVSTTVTAPFLVWAAFVL